MKTYLCVVRPVGLPARGEIDLALTTGRKNRVRVAGERETIVCDPEASRLSMAGDTTGDRVYPSTTRYTRLWNSDELALLAV